MNNIFCEKLNFLVDQWSKNNKMPIYGFDQMHVCTSKCKLIGEYPNFICTASRKIHVCGKNCDNPYTTSEGTFCSLTGFEVEGPVDQTSSLVVRDSCGKSTRHWGDRIRAGKKRRSKPACCVPKNTINLFQRSVKHFLFSEERTVMYNSEMEKFFTSISKLSKRHFCEKTSLQDASAQVSSVVDRHIGLCSPPAPKSVRWADSLAREIHNFWAQLDFKCTRKSVNALVAVSLSMMAKKEGYARDGVVYVKHSRLIAQYVVSDMQFGKFSGLTCRRMSIIQRELMKACLTPSGKQRIITPLHFLADKL